MANGGRANGGGKNAFFLLKTDHSGIVKADGTTAATAETDAVLIIKEENNAILGGTDLAFDSNAVPTVTLTSYKDDEALNTAIELLCPKVAGATTTTISEIKSETGSKKYGESGSNGKTGIDIIYSALGDDGKIKVTVVVASCKNESGSFKYAGETAVQPTLIYAGTKAKAEITVPKGLLDATIINATTATDLVVPINYYAKSFFLSPAA